jgi:cytochrome d ubiquinol oxidase subunit II
MSELHTFLANIWFFIVGLILVLYVVLDGFDLGVGIITLSARSEERRGIMMASLSSIWDANETWLVLLGGTLFGAFPVVYSVVLHALYIPLLGMLCGLILRGVAFEFREHARAKPLWNLSFGVGSLLAAMCQGFALGGLIQGFQVSGGVFTGSVLSWLTPFSILVAIGVTAGYILLGANYLIMKTEGPLQRDQIPRAKVSAWVMMVMAIIVTLWTPLLHDHVARKWFNPSNWYYLAPLPIFALFAFIMMLRALRRSYEHAPFFWSMGIFITSFAGLAISLYPYILPHELAVWEAAASSKTLVFMLTGVGMLLPIMLIYNAYQYVVFRGKVQAAGYGE